MNKKIELTNEQKIAIAELRVAISNLMKVSNTNHAALAGVLFGYEPPFLIRFGNIQERGSAFTEVIIRATDLAEEQEALGNVIFDNIKLE